jgi:poly(3-hydroxybutyrate) depolymerase
MTRRFWGALPALLLAAGGAVLGVNAAHAASIADATCSTTTGAPPIQTVAPVTVRPLCVQGQTLTFDQDGVTRYACLNLPQAARQRPGGHKWPLLVYLHGSLTTPDSLYTLDKNLFDLHDTYPLSGDPSVQGFLLLSPEGRIATPYAADTFETGTGFHWDEWYRDATQNLDALAIDHFLDAAVATGRVDASRIYLFGWSNGAYMAALYGNWRSDRIAAIGQYAGADPWSRQPCPVADQVTRQVPLVLLRNLCDAAVTCSTTSSWIDTLDGLDWPFQPYNLGLQGRIVSPHQSCDASCTELQGIYEHVRWPNRTALQSMLDFLRKHPLPAGS